MSRFFLKRQLFHKVLPESLFESEFEQKITLQAPDLYPDYFVIPFKKTVVSPTGKSKPDLVFIAKDYKDWYIVEVEMTHHNYHSHVEPQISNLATARYDREVINYLLNENTELDKDKTTQLILKTPAKILMILNAPEETWARDLNNKYGVITSVFEIFHCGMSETSLVLPPTAYGVSRSYPIYSVSTTTRCLVHPYLSYLGIEDNSELNLKENDEIILEYKNCVTFWKAQRGPGDLIWIVSTGRNAIINKRKEYRIVKLRNNSLLLDTV